MKRPHLRRATQLTIWTALGVSVVLLLPGLIELVVIVALGFLLAAVLLALLGLRMLRKTAAKLLEEQPHLRRLGGDFEHQYEGARVTAVDRDPQGQVHVQFTWEDKRTVQLDEHGMPDSMGHEGPGTAVWILPATDLGPMEMGILEDLPQSGVTIVEHGTVKLGGEAVQRRRMVSTNGLDLQMQCPVPAI